MDRVGPEARLIPEEDVGALRLGLSRDGRIGFPLPAFNGFWIALVSALQRLLRGQAELRQQFGVRLRGRPVAFVERSVLIPTPDCSAALSHF
jgi:hypothetical protein